MRHLARQVSLAAALLAAATHELAAQTSELYLTGTAGVVVVQNGVVTRHWTQPNVTAYGVAVVGSRVRTIGALTPAGAPSGFEYLLTGASTGTTYTATPTSQTAYDATSDGRNNYILGWNSQWVYRTGLDWSAPTQLFRVSTTPTSNAGITYDPTSTSFWVGGWGSGTVKHFSMTGQLLGSFSTGGPGRPRNVTGLAFDKADNTLWMSDYVIFPNTLFQYSLAGVLLRRVDFQTVGYGPMRILGGEFGAPGRFGITAAPEPATTTLLAVGFLAIGLAAWRRRRLSA